MILKTWTFIQKKLKRTFKKNINYLKTAQKILLRKKNIRWKTGLPQEERI